MYDRRLKTLGVELTNVDMAGSGLKVRFFPWQEKLIAPLDATLKNVAKEDRNRESKRQNYSTE